MLYGGCMNKYGKMVLDFYELGVRRGVQGIREEVIAIKKTYTIYNNC